MAEECAQPEVRVSRSLVLCISLGGRASLFFVFPLCFIIPLIEDIIATPYGQALPYISIQVVSSRAGALVLMNMIFFVTFLYPISITATTSHCTWAFSHDKALPLLSIWTSTVADSPVYARSLVTFIEMLLGFFNIVSSAAFTAFASVGVIALSGTPFPFPYRCLPG